MVPQRINVMLQDGMVDLFFHQLEYQYFLSLSFALLCPTWLDLDHICLYLTLSLLIRQVLFAVTVVDWKCSLTAQQLTGHSLAFTLRSLTRLHHAVFHLVSFSPLLRLGFQQIHMA